MTLELSELKKKKFLSAYYTNQLSLIDSEERKVSSVYIFNIDAREHRAPCEWKWPAYREIRCYSDQPWNYQTPTFILVSFLTDSHIFLFYPVKKIL
jgi:hypothetical protein